MTQEIEVNVKVSNFSETPSYADIADIQQDVEPEIYIQTKKSATKTSNGITIDVPIDDYMQLLLLKIRTGYTLRDLALQAIHEFVERNKIG